MKKLIHGLFKKSFSPFIHFPRHLSSKYLLWTNILPDTKRLHKALGKLYVELDRTKSWYSVINTRTQKFLPSKKKKKHVVVKHGG